MLLRWSEKIASFFVQRNLISPEQYDWAVYALQIRLLQYFAFPFLITVGTILSSLGAVICFLMSFSMLRRKIGGYHASTPLACFWISLLTVTISMSLGMQLMRQAAPVLLIILFSICLLVLLSQALLQYRIKSDLNRCKSFLLSCVTLIVLTVIAVLLFLTEFTYDCAYAIFLGVFTAVISLLPKNNQGGLQE